MSNYKIYIQIFFLIPVILLFFIIRIFKDFRINKIISKKIGHMATPMEIYICEKKDNPKKTPIIWFFDKIIANQCLKIKWSQMLLILPRYVLEPIYILFKKYKFFDFFLEDFSKDNELVQRHIKDGVKQIDDKNVLLKHKPSIEFTYKEINEGENYLKKIGFNNKNFFAFASRTAEFHNEQDESVRNANIKNKILGIKFLVSKGYKAIRMGKNVKQKINFNDKNILDYATSNDRSDFLDIYLISKCEFLVSASTGVSTIAALFRKPSLILNETSVHDLIAHPDRVMLLLKKYKNRNSGKIISFEEVYKKKLDFINSVSKINELGYDIIDNNEFEIKRASENFLNIINYNYNLDEILYRQKNYWQNIEKYFGFKNKYKTIICPDFYLNNINLFE